MPGRPLSPTSGHCAHSDEVEDDVGGIRDIDKRQLFASLRARLGERLDALRRSQSDVQSGAVHPESKQEHPKDTRAIEATYLARGLAERVETLRDELRALELLRVPAFGEDSPAGPGALVRIVDEADAATLCLLSPAGAGERLEAGRHVVLVLTPRSPLGAAIAGSRCGDDIDVVLPSGRLRGFLDAIA